MNAPPPPGLDTLTAAASSRTEFTFDRSMLSAADQYIENAPEAVQKAAAGIESITVRNYRFDEGTDHDERGMRTIDGSYKASGWKHLVNKNSRSDGSGLTTDLWMHFDGADINHIAVLVRGERNISFVSIACWLRPLDLLHLSGHFGIPKVDPNAVMVPAPDEK